MDDILVKLQQTARFLTENGFDKADDAIVLGTGLGSLLKHIDVIKTISYQQIPNFPEATVEFHKGTLIMAQIGDRKMIIMHGRFHYYEGYGMQEITFPIRVFKELGIKRLLLSNAAGSLNPTFRKGDLVLIEDHINLLPENPLRGLNSPEFGNRFVDMFQPYDPSLNQLIQVAGAHLGIEVKKGIYAAVMGPNLETKAEYRYLRVIGADMVGMSTVPEVIVANHIGLACAAISVITDECDPEHLQPVKIEEIIAVAGIADLSLSKILMQLMTVLK